MESLVEEKIFPPITDILEQVLSGKEIEQSRKDSKYILELVKESYENSKIFRESLNIEMLNSVIGIITPIDSFVLMITIGVLLGIRLEKEAIKE